MVPRALLIAVLFHSHGRADAQGFDTATYDRFHIVYAQNDAGALRELATPLLTSIDEQDKFLGALVLAGAAYRSDDAPDCLRWLDTLNIDRSGTDPVLRAVGHKLKALVMNDMGRNEDGLREIQLGLDLLDAQHRPREYVDLHVVAAEIHIQMSALDLALEKLSIAQRVSEMAHYDRGQCMSTLVKGNILFDQQRYNEANATYRHALRQALDGDYEMLAQNAASNISGTLIMQQRFDESEALCDSLLRVLGTRSPAFRANLLSDRGYLATLSDEHDDALLLYERALLLFDSLDDRRGSLKAQQHKAGSLWEKGHRSEAINTLLGVINGSQEIMWPRLEMEARSTLAWWFEQLGDYKQAYEQIGIEMSLGDSLTKAMFNDQVARSEVLFQTERKDHQIAAQAQALALATAEARRKNLQRLALAAGVIALAIITLLLARSLRQRQRLAAKEREVHARKVDELMHRNEIDAINAMLEGQEKERERVAKDLHDRLGSMLSAIKMQVGALEGDVQEVRSTQADQHRKVERLLDEAVGEVRRISHDMVTTTLSRFGLAKALEDLCDSVRVTGKLGVELQLFGLEHRLERSVEITLYRIVQELVSNVLKHADASELSISVTRQPGRLSVMVADDGHGFEPATVDKGIGLQNVRSRAATLGATVQLDSALGRGTTVSVECPVVE